jgi:cyclomaltodextrinase
MISWAQDATFYHIYPLGFCGAPRQNDFTSSPVERLEKIKGWIDHMLYLGVNAVYLGPVFESTTHGYNTADYYHVDRRLGSNDTLARLSRRLHEHGMRVVLDGVFNHVGRDFFAFKDLQANGSHSAYKDWFANLRFDQASPYHDLFTYEGWNGHYSLVKLNLRNPEVKEHLFGAVRKWVEEFDIDGLRLDAADSIEHDFLKELSRFCRIIKPDFWLMGEVVHGDYRQWANADELDSVTNYECYKGLHSSYNEQNFFEIGYSLNRQFGEAGIYRHLNLYTFADNHDVNRVASTLKNSAHLLPLYLLLFCMPGIPSIYYGSEFGIQGKKDGSDAALRPNLDLNALNAQNPHSELTQAIHRLSELRQKSAALRRGEYRQVHVDREVFVFFRQANEDWALVAINASAREVQLSLGAPSAPGGRLVDALNGEVEILRQAGQIQLDIPPYWGQVVTAG